MTAGILKWIAAALAGAAMAGLQGLLTWIGGHPIGALDPLISGLVTAILMKLVGWGISKVPVVPAPDAPPPTGRSH